MPAKMANCTYKTHIQALQQLENTPIK